MRSAEVVVSCMQNIQFPNALGPIEAYGAQMGVHGAPMGRPWHCMGGPWRPCGAHAAPLEAHGHPWKHQGGAHVVPLRAGKGGKETLYQQTHDQPHQRPLCYMILCRPCTNKLHLSDVMTKQNIVSIYQYINISMYHAFLMCDVFAYNTFLYMRSFFSLLPPLCFFCTTNSS